MAMNGAPSASAELARASARLHSAAPLAEALAHAVEELRAAVRAQAVALALVTPGDEELEYVDREPLPLLDQLIQARTRALMAAPSEMNEMAGAGERSA